MTSRKEVDLGVGGQDPEAVVLAPEGLHACALGHVPHADALVLRVGHNDVLRERSNCSEPKPIGSSPATARAVPHAMCSICMQDTRKVCI